MNKPNTKIKRWGIVVVQSLTPNDVKTGENLYHDVLQYKEYHKRESFSSFYDVNSSNEFRLAVLDIENHCRKGIFLPYNSRLTAVMKVSVSIMEKFLNGRISTISLELLILKRDTCYLL